MKDKFISKYWGYLFLLIPIILQVIFFYLPTIRGVIFSFTNWTGLTDNYDYIGLKIIQLFSVIQNLLKQLSLPLFSRLV